MLGFEVDVMQQKHFWKVQTMKKYHSYL